VSHGVKDSGFKVRVKVLLYRSSYEWKYNIQYRTSCTCTMTVLQWRRQESAIRLGCKVHEVWGREVPQRGPGADPRWG